MFVICTDHWVQKCELVQGGCDIFHRIGEIKSANKIVVGKLKVYDIMAGGVP